MARVRPLILLALVIAARPAQAARPFVTDDARLTTAGSCQLESWVRTYRDSREIWALPACNPGGNLELTLGGGRAVPRDTPGPATQDYVVQVKTLLRPLTTNDWGWGVALGAVRHPDITPGPNLLGNTYAYLPASRSFADDRVVLHVNVGWLRERGIARDNLTWGLGAEIQSGTPVTLIAETFGDHRNRPYWQVGARWTLIPDLLQIDATTGGRWSGEAPTRWISFGLRLTPARLF